MTLTRDEIAQALPANLKSAATQQFADRLNNIVSDPDMAKEVRDNFISYTHVLKEGRYKTDDYLNAVVYVSFKLLGKTNEEAYSLTFPTRYRSLLSKGTSQKDISSYVSMYNKNKLVQLIMQQTLTPSWVLNQDMYQKALNVQYELMTTAVSEKVRTDAADSLLSHLKAPEVKEVNLNLGIQENSGLNELKAALQQVAAVQAKAIENGVSTREIAGAKLIEGTATEVVR